MIIKWGMNLPVISDERDRILSAHSQSHATWYIEMSTMTTSRKLLKNYNARTVFVVVQTSKMVVANCVFTASMSNHCQKGIK